MKNKNNNIENDISESLLNSAMDLVYCYIQNNKAAIKTIRTLIKSDSISDTYKVFVSEYLKELIKITKEAEINYKKLK